MGISKTIRCLSIALITCGLYSCLALKSAAQQRLNSPNPQLPTLAQSGAPSDRVYGGYVIGVGDIVNIRVAEEDDVNGRYQVTQSGDIELPLLSKPVHAAGLTTFDFSKRLGAELKQQQILKEPYVTVFIERGMTQNVSIVGPVARPGVYPIEKPTRLMDVLSMSGGLLPTAGGTIAVSHPLTAKSSAPGSPNSSTDAPTADIQTVDVAVLMSGDPKGNIVIKEGDQITVAGSSVVYVVGAVTRPGAFAIQDARDGMTVLRAIALVEGPLPTASLGKAIIVRRSESQTDRQEIPLDLDKIMKGKVQDPVLSANDILFVPQSGFKKGVRKMGDVAAAAAGQVAGYGLGLRIAN